MQKITTFLWFDDQAEQAANFYTSIFDDAEIVNVSRQGDGVPGTPGIATIVTFQIGGQEFMALNGGPHFKFNEAVSLFVRCESQEEIDYFWEKLSEDGEPGQCGWLKDRYGLSWQIVPSGLSDLMSEPAKAEKVMQALLQMEKIDFPSLQRVYQEA